MRPNLLERTLLGATLMAGAATAAADAALAERKFCFSCHHVTETGLGPSFQAISARHAARRAQMAPVLAYKIRQGGGGNWGVVPMVPSQNVSEAEAAALARWILDLPGDKP